MKSASRRTLPFVLGVLSIISVLHAGPTGVLLFQDDFNRSDGGTDNENIGGGVIFAGLVGENINNSLQHVQTKPVPLK